MTTYREPGLTREQSQPMTRDELEAAIWRAYTERVGGGLVDAFEAIEDSRMVDAILQAADKYARHVGGITSERREVIGASRATRKRDLRKP